MRELAGPHPRFIAAAVPRWLAAARIDTPFIGPGKPWQNGTDESMTVLRVEA